MKQMISRITWTRPLGRKVLNFMSKRSSSMRSEQDLFPQASACNAKLFLVSQLLLNFWQERHPKLLLWVLTFFVNFSVSSLKPV